MALELTSYELGVLLEAAEDALELWYDRHGETDARTSTLQDLTDRLERECYRP